MGTCKVVTLAMTVIALFLMILILVKLFSMDTKENYLKGSITCAYAMGGGNTAYCNDWLRSYRKGQLCNTNDCHPNSNGLIACKPALDCCNQLATCGGKSCQINSNNPITNPNIMYDQDILLDK